MSRVGLVVHPDKPEAADRARTITRWLAARHHEAVELSPVDADRGDPASTPVGLDLLLSLGGDGTMLRTVDLAAPHGIPVLGVNVGDLGYLTAVEPEGVEAALDAFFAGDHTLERRLLIEAMVERAGEPAEPVTAGPLALNETVVEKVQAALDNIQGGDETASSDEGAVDESDEGSDSAG